MQALCHWLFTGFYTERNDAKSLVKGANSPLKAVIPTLMEIVFNRLSEKTGREMG